MLSAPLPDRCSASITQKPPLLRFKLRKKAAHPIINLVRDSLRVLARDIESWGERHRTSVRRVVRRTSERRSAVSGQATQPVVGLNPAGHARDVKLGATLADKVRLAIGHRPAERALAAGEWCGSRATGRGWRTICRRRYAIIAAHVLMIGTLGPRA